jgi:hypothetical protein
LGGDLEETRSNARSVQQGATFWAVTPSARKSIAASDQAPSHIGFLSDHVEARPIAKELAIHKPLGRPYIGPPALELTRDGSLALV